MVDFNKLIDSHLARELSYKKLGRYYPSEIGGCMRKTWYSYKKPKPTDVEKRKFYLKTALKLHPDKNPHCNEDANEKFRLLKKLYSKEPSREQ